MLSQKNRIPRKLFVSLRGGRLFHSTHFTLRAVPAPKGVRIGVSTSKKVSKRAVVRNTVRRRAYAALAPLLDTLADGIYLLSAKPGAEKTKGEALATELAELMKKS